jgi:site-specific DNA recombinase
MASRRRGPAAGDPKVAVAYLRVSTDEQQLGPEAQRAGIERWAAGEGVRVASWHIDQGVSGGAPLAKRKALETALAALAPAGAGLLVVAKRDRLARDVIAAAIIESLAGKAGARVVSAAGEGGAGGDDPSAQLMRTLIDAFAQYERAIIRNRTRAALAVKKGRGERTGGVPYGQRVGADGRLEENPAEWEIVATVRGLAALGKGAGAIARELKARAVVGRTGRPLSSVQVGRIVHGQAYGRSKPKTAVDFMLPTARWVTDPAWPSLTAGK